MFNDRILFSILADCILSTATTQKTKNGIFWYENVNCINVLSPSRNKAFFSFSCDECDDAFL